MRFQTNQQNGFTLNSARTNRSCVESGFTIIEAMAGIAVLTMGLVFVLQVFSLINNVQREQALQNTALFLAQEKIEEITSTNFAGIPIGLTSESPMVSPFEKFSLTTNVFFMNSDFTTTTMAYPLKRIEVIVSFISPWKGVVKEARLISLLAEK